MERKMQVTRTYPGNAPGEEWDCVEIFNMSGTIWYLYEKDEVKDGWRNFKLTARDRVPLKANYWFGWNGNRANAASDWATLTAGRPELHTLVLLFLTQSA